MDIWRENSNGYLCFQIFTNADKAHADQVLRKLGLEGCFEGIICFETLNPPLQQNDNMDTVSAEGEAEIGVIDGIANNGFRPKSRVLCKPSVEAIEAAIRIANVDPKKTVKPALILSILV